MTDNNFDNNFDYSVLSSAPPLQPLLEVSPATFNETAKMYEAEVHSSTMRNGTWTRTLLGKISSAEGGGIHRITQAFLDAGRKLTEHNEFIQPQPQNNGSSKPTSI